MDDLSLTPVDGDPWAAEAPPSQWLPTQQFKTPDGWSPTQPPVGQVGAAPLDDFGSAAVPDASRSPPTGLGSAAVPDASPPTGLAAIAGDPSQSMFARVPAAIGSVLADRGFGLAKSVWGAVTLPGDVARGSVDPSSPEAIDRSTDLAGMLTLPAAEVGAVADPNALGIFAGAKAKTADLGALNTFRELTSAGLKPESAYPITGWLRGVDDKPRFEVSDARSYIKPEGFDTGEQSQFYTRAKLGDVLHHPDLFDAYPDMKDTTVVLNYGDPAGSAAYYHPSGSYPELISLGGDEKYLADHPKVLQSTLLHEIQHAVARREDFSYGSSPGSAGSYEAYWRNAGEVEARNVQNRWANPEQSLRPPWRSQDVPSEQQWVNQNQLAAHSQPASLTPVQGDPFANEGLSNSEAFAKRTPLIYNAPNVLERPFESDYPAGAPSDATGKLIQDIEGRPLTAPYVAGRRMVGGPDEGISNPVSRDVAGSLGAKFSDVPAATIGGDSGRLTLERGSGGTYPNSRIDLNLALPAPQKALVANHETGHLIDELAGTIDASGLNGELRGVYNTLNNPQNYGKPFGPENSGYKGADVKRELMAEAVRAYMENPNYLKSAAPKTASAIRAAVNANPRIARTIQFNASGLPITLVPVDGDPFSTTGATP